MEQLQNALAKEKRDKADKRVLERVAAMKVIEENKAEKAKRMAEKLAEREAAQKLIADAIRHGEE